MKFKEGNKIKYMQDHSFWCGVPADVDFEVGYFKIGDCKDENKYVLTAYGYGQLEPHDNHSYGNGKLYIYGLTEEEKKQFEREVGKKPKADEMQETICQAHMAGQMDAGCKEPSWSNAFAYFKKNERK